MNYLLDTNHWSYLQRGHASVLSRLESLPDGATILMPVVAQAELLAGVDLAASGRRREQLRSFYEHAVREVTEILDINSDTAIYFARIFVALRRKGRPIETNDIWVAAIAVAHNLILVSNDSHFRQVEGLRLEDWTKPPSPSC